MSNLIDQASLVMIPSGYKEDKIYSQVPTDGSGDLTFSRASDGTRVNSQGLVERVPWNLLLQSNSFSTTWTTVNASVTSGQTGYDGSSNAWLLEKTTYNGRIQQGFSQGGLQTYSIYAKKGLSDYLRLYVDGAVPNVYFNLTDGSIYSGSNYIDASITDVGNGWYHCQVTFDGSSTLVRIYPAEAGSTSISQSGSVYIQDAQINEGSTAKPYFPTTDRQDVPRLDYSGGCPSLLLEPQRTNIALYSEQLDNAVWIKSGVTVTANNTQSPDGTQNADKVTTATTLDFISQIISAPTATAYAASFYIKNEDSTLTEILVRNSVSNLFGELNWNGSQLVSITGVTNGTLTFEAVGNDWYRIFAYFTSVETVQRLRIYPDKIATGKSVYVWGYQLEQGATYATSYIPTTSASVTRVKDEASKTGISSLIGQTEGTLFAEVDLTHSSSSNHYILQIFQDSSNRILLYRSSGNVVGCYLLKASGSIYDTTTVAAFTGRTKLAFAYKSGDISFYVNGSQIGTSSATFSAFSSLSDLNIDSNNGTENGYFSYNEVVIFPTRLTNAELAALTTL